MTQPPSSQERFTLSAGQICSYQLQNHAGVDVGRLAEYGVPFHLSPQVYLRCPGGSLTTDHCLGFDRSLALVEDTIPFCAPDSPRLQALWDQQRLRQMPVVELGRCVGSLLDFRGWHDNYFHWFLDLLPRVFAAEHHHRLTGERVLMLVPQRLALWQSESLYRLRPQGVDFAALPAGAKPSRLRGTSLIARSGHRWQRGKGVPFDALSPADVLLLADRLKLDGRYLRQRDLPRRVVIVRKQASSRRLLNEFEVMAHLGRHGFVTVSLEELTLATQIALFHGATHVISVHGSALTNLIHARRAAVLEVFSPQHGTRPEFFQLASIKKLPYFFDACASIAPAGDVVIPLASLDRFLAATL